MVVKAKPLRINDNKYESCEADQATHLRMQLPGPVGMVILPVVRGNAPRAGTPCWSWNGNVDTPTLKPSLLINGVHRLSDTDYDRIMAGCKVKHQPFRCHTWITDGKVRFLPDTDHGLSGQTVGLLDVEDDEC